MILACALADGQLAMGFFTMNMNESVNFITFKYLFMM
jgi:hypothetical protein